MLKRRKKTFLLQQFSGCNCCCTSSENKNRLRERREQINVCCANKSFLNFSTRNFHYIDCFPHSFLHPFTSISPRRFRPQPFRAAPFRSGSWKMHIDDFNLCKTHYSRCIWSQFFAIYQASCAIKKSIWISTQANAQFLQSEPVMRIEAGDGVFVRFRHRRCTRCRIESNISIMQNCSQSDVCVIKSQCLERRRMWRCSFKAFWVPLEHRFITNLKIFSITSR